MTGSSNDNGKISDSAYTNVSQSQRSSGSSFTRNSNRSESSGYCEGFSVFNSSKRNDKARKKEKSKKATTTTQTTTTTTTTSLDNIGTELGSQINDGKANELGNCDSNGSSSDFTSNDKKSDEVARVELADDTRLGEYQRDSISTAPEEGVGTSTNLLDDTTSNTNAGFSAVISLEKGLVIDVTPSLQTALGYTKESWIDGSFIDFVHPKDKRTFADHLTKNIALEYEGRDRGLSGCQSNLFCMLKKYDERVSTTESGSDQSNYQMEAKSLYLPFHLTTSIKYFRERASDEKPRMMLLAINAEPIVPVYKAPKEMIISAIFSTRHDPSCILTHVDDNVVQYFGYMPHDMIGHSLFDFYHPEDLPFLKDIYETIVKMKGAPFRSEPYRFAVQNGGYVVLETEWSSFYNPWQEKLEFVVGHHRVLRGPMNPNVFQSPSDNQRILLANITEEMFKESMIIQGEIRALLKEEIERTDDIKACKVKPRSKDLGTFVENLLREVKSLTPISKKRLTPDERSLSEHESVILRAISPAQECCDSKSSTETPPSYNQLNYNEKIMRFFDSNLFLTMNCVSDEDNNNSSAPSNDDAGKTNSNLAGTKAMSRDENYNGHSPNEHLKIPMLTESVLNRHNQDMEKLFVQQHKKRRCTNKSNVKKNDETSPKNTKETTYKNGKRQTTKWAEKRRSSDEHESPNCKISKVDENTRKYDVILQPTATHTPMNTDDDSPRAAQTGENTNIWPSPEVTLRPPLTSHLSMSAQNNGTTQEISRYRNFPPFVPIYYVPLPITHDDFLHVNNPPILSQYNNQHQHNTYDSNTIAPLGGVIYVPMVCPNPAPVPSMYRPFVVPGPVPIHRETPQSNSGVSTHEHPQDRRRPLSQATSIKAEAGSSMAMSESSKKSKKLSLGEQFSSCVSIDGGCSSLVPNTKPETSINSQSESYIEDSSDSSFYGSFLTKSNLSSCSSKLSSANPSKKNLWKPTIMKPTSNERKQLDMLMKGPPWQKDVKMTNKLMYQYQIAPKPLNEILEADMKALQSLNQPQLVKDQLAQLYSDMELDTSNFSGEIEQGIAVTSIDSDCGSNVNKSPDKMQQPKFVRNEMNHALMSLIYEENAPLPSP